METSLVNTIRVLADRKNMNLKQVGKESGLGENSIYRWDKNSPTLDSLKKVAKVLEVSVEELLKGK